MNRILTPKKVEEWTTYAMVCLVVGLVLLWIAHVIAGTLDWPGRILTGGALAWLICYWVASELGCT